MQCYLCLNCSQRIKQTGHTEGVPAGIAARTGCWYVIPLSRCLLSYNPFILHLIGLVPTVHISSNENGFCFVRELYEWRVSTLPDCPSVHLMAYISICLSSMYLLVYLSIGSSIYNYMFVWLLYICPAIIGLDYMM